MNKLKDIIFAILKNGYLPNMHNDIIMAGGDAIKFHHDTDIMLKLVMLVSPSVIQLPWT